MAKSSAVRSPRPSKPRAPRLNLYASASKGRVGTALRGLSETRLTEVATKIGAAAPEGGGVAGLRKAIAAKAYEGIAASRTLAGYGAGTAPRAAALLTKVPAVSAVSTVATAALDVSKQAAAGFGTGGVRGAVTSAASALGTRGKVALVAGATGFAAYEAREGYKLDGKRGAVYGALDGAANILSAGVVGASAISKITGYDYGEARRKSEAEAKGEAKTSEGDIDVPKLAQRAANPNNVSEISRGLATTGTTMAAGYFGAKYIAGAGARTMLARVAPLVGPVGVGVSAGLAAYGAMKGYKDTGTLKGAVKGAVGLPTTFETANRNFQAKQLPSPSGEVRSFERDRRTSSGVVVHETVKAHARRPSV